MVSPHSCCCWTAPADGNPQQQQAAALRPERLQACSSHLHQQALCHNALHCCKPLHLLWQMATPYMVHREASLQPGSEHGQHNRSSISPQPVPANAALGPLLERLAALPHTVRLKVRWFAACCCGVHARVSPARTPVHPAVWLVHQHAFCVCMCVRERTPVCVCERTSVCS